MFKREKKSVVYRSKQEDDWKVAQDLLKEAGIEFKEIATEEVPVGGCGCKIDPRRFADGAPKEISKRVYRIEVAEADKEKADAALEGKVLPVRSYGMGVQ